MNESLQITSAQPQFKSRYSVRLRFISVFVILSFISHDVVRAEDFRLQRERQKDGKFLPRYLLEQQKNHEEFIQQKEDSSNLQRSLDAELTARLRAKKKKFEDDDRRRGGSSDGPLQYTLGDEDENGEPTTLNEYEYDESGDLV